MGIKERKERERAERSRLILEKTKNLIIENGLDGFSMQDIASATELNKATLYLYFKNKEDLLFAILREAVEKFGTHLQAHITPDLSGRECFNALKEAYFDSYGESQDIFTLIGIMNYIEPHFPLTRGNSDGDSEDMYGNIKKIIAAVIARGIEDGTLSPHLDPDITARLFLLVSTSIIDRVARLPKSRRDTALVFRELEAVFYLLVWGAVAPGIEKPPLPEGLTG